MRPAENDDSENSHNLETSLVRGDPHSWFGLEPLAEYLRARRVYVHQPPASAGHQQSRAADGFHSSCRWQSREHQMETGGSGPDVRVRLDLCGRHISQAIQRSSYFAHEKCRPVREMRVRPSRIEGVVSRVWHALQSMMPDMPFRDETEARRRA